MRSAARGVETYAPDIRGHGGSGTRGDIAYIGQLENDLADLVAVVRKTSPNQPLTLLGHSAGGGFALRVASSPIRNLFARTVLLAPYLGYDAPTNRPDSGGWASADIPRFLALTVLAPDRHRLLRVVADAGLCGAAKLRTDARFDLFVPPDAQFRDRAITSEDFAAVTRPVTLFAGAADELMLPDKYADAVHAIAPSVDVKLIDGVSHVGIVSDPKAVSAIAVDVATRGTPGT